MGYQKSTLDCSQHVLLHVVCLRRSSVLEDVSDSTMVDLSDTFMGDPDFAKPPELTSALKPPKVREFVGPLKEERVPTLDTSMSKKQLIAKQSKDVSLSTVFSEMSREGF